MDKFYTQVKENMPKFFCSRSTHKITKYFYSFLLVSALFVLRANAQVTLDASNPAWQPATLVQGGAPGTFTVAVKNSTTSTLTGAILKITLPAGMEYVSGTVTGATEKDITNLNVPSFNVPGIASGLPNNISFNVRINCGYTASGAQLQYQLTDAEGTVIATTTGNNAASTPAPAFVFSTAPAPQALTVQLNTNGTRTVKIKNTSNVSVTTMYLESDVVTASQLPAYKVVSADNGTLTAATGGYLITLTGIALKNAITTGNGDASFDPNEELTIMLTEEMLTCTLGSPINLVLKAGSGDSKGGLCAAFSTTNTASIVATVGDPAISLTRLSGTTFPDFCNNGKASYTITNTGTASYGAAANIYTIKLPWSITRDNAIATATASNTSIVLKKVSINGTDITAQVLKLNGGAAPYIMNGVAVNGWVIDLGGLTQAYGTSLQDLNGDGKFDDLAPGKSFQLDIEYGFDISKFMTCTLNSWGVPNDATGFCNFGTYFTDQCGAVTIKSNYVWGSATTTNSPNFMVAQNNALIGSAIVNAITLNVGDKTTISVGIGGNLSGAYIQNGKTLKTFSFTLPDGLAYDPTGSLIYNNGSTGSSTFSATDINWNVATKTLTLTPAVSQLYVATGATDNFTIPVVAINEPVVNKNISFNANMGFVGCSVTAPYGCNTKTLNYAVIGGPCATVSTTAFGLMRTTFGFIPSPSGYVWYKPTGFVNENTAGINLKSAQSKDNVKASFAAVVRGTGFSELWARLQYVETGTNPQLPNFEPISGTSTDIAGTVTVKKASDGSTLSTNILVGDLQFSYKSAQSTQYQQLNLGAKIGAGKAINYTLAAGDSIFVTWMTKVSAGNVYSTYTLLPNLQGDIYTKNTSGNETGCIPIPDNFYVERIYINANSYIGVAGILGNGSYGFSCSILNGFPGGDIGGDHFPNETRVYANFRNVTWTIPGIWAWDGSQSPAINTTGTPVGYNLFPSAFAVSYSGGNTIVNFTNDAWDKNGMPLSASNIPVVADWQSPNGNTNVKFYMKPVCVSNTTSLTYKVSMNTDKYTTAQDNSNIVNSTDNYTTSGTVSYTGYSANTNPLLQNIDGISQTVTWPIQITNTTDKTSFTAGKISPDLPYNWISITAPHNNIQVVKVVNALSGTSYPVTSYGTGKYWVKLGSIASDSIYNVVAAYSTCNTDSVYYTSGFSPSAYPIDPDQGFASNASACTQGSAWLRLYPKDAALTMTVTSPVNPVEFCTNADGNPLNYKITVTNTATADANNLVVEGKFPAGYTAKAGTSKVTYNGVTKTIADPVYNSAKGVWQWKISADPSKITDSLPGAAGGGVNTFTLQYQGATQCGFSSGTSVAYQVTSQTGCGQERDYAANGSAMTLSMVPASINSYFVTPTNISLNTAGNAATYTISLINQGAGTLGASEYVKLSMPAGVDTVANSVVSVINAGNVTDVVSDVVDGTTRTLTFKLPMGASGTSLESGEAASFKFSLKISDASLLTCGTFPGVLDASTTFVLTSKCNGADCPINIITGHAVSDLTISKAVLTPVVKAASVEGNNVTVTYVITNSGAVATIAATSVDFFLDANGNGKYDAGETIYSTQSVNDNLAASTASTVQAVTFAVPARTEPCSILVAIRSASNPQVCSDSYTALPCGALISVKKTTNATNVKAGSNVTFTISVTNSGIKDTTGVKIMDLPTGFTYVSNNSATGGTYDGAANTWTVDVPHGTTQSINVVMQAAATGPYSNIAVGGNDDPYDPANPVDTAKFAAISVKKTTNATNVKAGDNITFTISVTNDGTKDTTGVKITDLPTGFTYVSNNGATSGTYDVSTNSWTVDVMHGATQSINVVMKAVAAGPYSNVAIGGNNDPNDPTTPVDTAKFAALSVKKVTTATNVKAGNNVTFTLSVTNNGTKDTVGVKIMDIPTGFTYVSNNSATSGAYDGATNIWTVDVPHGTTQSINVVMQAAATGPYSNIAVGGNNDPHDPTNPVDTAKFAAISVKKTTTATNVKAGDNVTFTISATNDGTKDTTGVKITDLPTGFTYVSNNGATSGTYNAATNVWTVDLAHGATQSINVVMKAAAAGPYSNVAIGGNNDPNDPTTPVDTAKFVSIVAVKSVQDANNNGKAEAGEILTYTIKVHNLGTAYATNIVVTDAVPAHTTYVTGSGGTMAGNTVTFTDNGLPANASHTYTFQVKVDADLTGVTSISNIAMAAVDNADPVPTEKEDPNNPGMPDPACKDPNGCPTDLPANGIKSFVALKSVKDANGDNKAEAGEELTYTINVINTGSVRLDNIVVSDNVPAHTTYVPGSGGVLNGNTVTFSGVNLAVGASSTYSFRVKVTDDIAGIGATIANVATVIADTIPSTPTKPVDPNNPIQPDPACTDPSGCPTVLPVDDNIIGVRAVCVNSTTTLADAISGGVWSSNNTAIVQVNANTGVVTGISAGTATISYTVNGKTVTADVTVNPLPVVAAITGKTDICIDGGGTLTNAVTGGVWASSNTAIVTIDATSGVMTSVGEGTGVIKYTVTDANTKCQSTVQTDVTVYPIPVVPAITGATQVCQQSTIQLSNTVTGGAWNSSDNTIATVDNNGNVTGIGNGTADISYTVTNAGSCATTVKTTITVNKKPVITTTTIAPVCAPNTIDLKTGISNYDANNYTYTFTDATGAAVANPAAVSATGTYNVVAENISNFCSSDVQTLQVKINPKPVVNVITLTPGEVCAPSTVNIQSLITNYDAATYSYNYTDQYGNTIATPTAVSASGNYTVTATDKVNDTHCSSLPVTVVVTVNPQPVITIVNNGNMALCGNTGTVDLTTGITNYNSDYTYTFTDAAGNLLNNVSAISIQGTYYVTAADTKCSSVRTAITLTRYTTPLVTVTDPAAVYDPYTMDITAPAVTAGSTAGLNYTYYDSNNQLVPATAAQQIGGVGNYTYYIQGTSEQGCKSNLAPVHVVVKERPVLSISSAEIWEGQKATLTISLPTGVTLPDDIVVNLGAGHPSTTIRTGEYVMPGTVTVPANANAATFIVNTWDNNVLDLDRTLDVIGNNSTYKITDGTVLIHDSTSLKPQNLVITIGRDTIYGSGTGAVSVSLPAGISTSYAIPVSIYPASGTTIKNGDYTMPGIVTIEPGNGSSVLSITVLNTAPEDRKLNLTGSSTGFVVKDGSVYIRQSRINVVPLVSDNGDGINDYLKIEGIEKYTNKMGGNNKVVLFNRWEDVIYEASNYDNASIKFDGRGNKHGAGRVPDGVYFYAITITIPDNELAPGESKTQTFKGYFRLQK